MTRGLLYDHWISSGRLGRPGLIYCMSLPPSRSRWAASCSVWTGLGLLYEPPAIVDEQQWGQQAVGGDHDPKVVAKRRVGCRRCDVVVRASPVGMARVRVIGGSRN
jgi:hypothetical protein